MMEPRDRIEPPEIREPQDTLRLVEFYVNLSEPRPEMQLLDLVKLWLGEQPPLTIHGLQTNYQPASDDGEPAVLIGLLFVGGSIDLG